MKLFTQIIYLIIASLSVKCNSIDLSESCRKFSIELLYHTAQECDNHIVMSPFGIWSLMAGISYGAERTTLHQMLRALRIPGITKTNAKAIKNLTDTVLTTISQEINVTSKNFMFIDNSLKVNKSFKTLSQLGFNTEIKSLSFDNPDVADIANEIIKHSGAQASDVLTSVDFTDSSLVVTNVVTFKGVWKSPFKKMDTKLKSFYDEEGTQIGKVYIMSNTISAPYSSIDDLNSTAVELKYGHTDEYSMLLILPNIGYKAINIYKELGKIGIKSIFQKLDDDTEQYGLNRVIVKMPRFEIKTNIALNKPINNIGIYDAFDPRNADFSKLSDQPLFVKTLIHNAEIQVTEEGTTASAASSIRFVDKSKPPEFRANRPFIFFIVQKRTKSILFGGIYSKPTFVN